MSIRFRNNETELNEDNLNAVVDFTRQAHDEVAIQRRLFNAFLIQSRNAITVRQAKDLKINVAQARNEKTLTVISIIVRGYPLLRDLENRLAQYN